MIEISTRLGVYLWYDINGKLYYSFQGFHLSCI